MVIISLSWSSNFEFFFKRSSLKLYWASISFSSITHTESHEIYLPMGLSLQEPGGLIRRNKILIKSFTNPYKGYGRPFVERFHFRLRTQIHPNFWLSRQKRFCRSLQHLFGESFSSLYAAYKLLPFWGQAPFYSFKFVLHSLWIVFVVQGSLIHWGLKYGQICRFWNIIWLWDVANNERIF